MDDLTIAADEVTDVGDSVLVAAHWQGVGKESGALGDRRCFDVWTFRGRTAMRVEFFSDRADALEALGLRA